MIALLYTPWISRITSYFSARSSPMDAAMSFKSDQPRAFLNLRSGALNTRSTAGFQRMMSAKAASAAQSILADGNARRRSETTGCVSTISPNDVTLTIRIRFMGMLWDLYFAGAWVHAATHEPVPLDGWIA